MSTVDPEKVIDFYSKRLDETKWEISFRTKNGIQTRKLKRINKLGIWTGLFLLPFWGIGFIIWILVLIDYWLQQEKIIFVSVDQMIEQLKAAK